MNTMSINTVLCADGLRITALFSCSIYNITLRNSQGSGVYGIILCLILFVHYSGGIMNILIDGMGGDYAPQEIVKGAISAARKIEDTT